MSDTVKTYVAILLDSSGSMSTIQQEAINHFNEQIQVLKEESNAPNQVAKKMLQDGEPKGVETRVTFKTFDQRVKTIYSNEDVNAISEINDSTYSPSGTTALYDAIGETIEEFQSYEDIYEPNVSVLFTIITDGHENASERFGGGNGQKRVKSQIDELQNTGKWTFTFMGANQNVMETAVQDLGIYAGNTMSFDYDKAGMNIAAQAHSMSTRAYFSARRDGDLAVQSFYDDNEED